MSEESGRAGVEPWRVRAGALKNPFRRRNGSAEGMGQVAGGEIHRWDSGPGQVVAASAIGGGEPRAPLLRRDSDAKGLLDPATLMAQHVIAEAGYSSHFLN